ncbi:MAG: helix-turn-helix transcriptional regulator [Proteobacteria bacterium]|nr:helix-turn-helix transcriptional regulator [Pseudomonadota bacterium]
MALAAFTTVLASASVFVISDAYFDFLEAPPDPLNFAEAAIAIALVCGSFLGIVELRRNHRLLNSHEEALAAASGALADVIEAQFTEWRLTPAEREIGMLALKGFDIAEIAQLRGAAQGTVRAQMTSIYAKSGTSGRAQFAAFFVEDLLAGGVGGPARRIGASTEAAE